MDEVAEHEVDLDRIARLRAVARALEGDQRAAGRLGQRLALGMGADHVPVTVQDEGWAAHPFTHRPEILSSREVDPALGVDERLGSGCQRPPDGVLDLLGRVRLVEALREEELEEALEVPAPVVPVVLRPRLIGVEQVLERVEAPLGVARRERDRGTDVNDRVDSLRVVGGQNGGGQRPAREADQRRARGAGDIHHRERVRDRLVDRVCVRAGGLIRAPAAASVERDHPAMAREIRNLELPEAGVGDRPRRKQQRGRVALAVHLVEHPDPVAVDIPRLVRVASAGLLGRNGGRCRGPAHRCARGLWSGSAGGDAVIVQTLSLRRVQSAKSA